MSRTSLRRNSGCVLALLALVALASTAAAPAAPVALRFSAPVKLPRWSGSEPSLAVDASGRVVYVTAPQHIPAAFNGVIDMLDPPTGERSGPNGVGFWASIDGGKTFRRNANIGSGTGGGDSDVVVGADHRVYVADLEAVASSICSSDDAGASFTSRGLPQEDACNNLSFNHQGPESDRQWLNAGRKGELYLTYHDFMFGYPLAFVSADKGATFTPCGSMFDPQGPAAANYLPQNGTLVAKPVIGPDGSMYTTITEPDRVAPPVGASLNHVFVAASEGPCSATSVFKNYSIYEDPGARFTLFQSIGMDGGGVLYAVAAGVTKAGQANNNIWLFVSRTKGKTWSKPIRVNAPSLTANVMPAVVGGLGANQVAIGWFGTSTNPDPNHETNQWRYYAATSLDGGRTFRQAAVTPRPAHYGDVCTQGVFCGLVPGQPGNRNLADFSSIAVNPVTGCVIVAFPGDPYNRPDIGGANNFESSAYVATQTGGTCLARPRKR